jgi:hypothetical protein
MRQFDRFLHFDHQGDVSQAPDLETILPILAGEATITATSGDTLTTSTGRRLKRLTVGSPHTAPIAARPDRVERRARTR